MPNPPLSPSLLQKAMQLLAAAAKGNPTRLPNMGLEELQALLHNAEAVNATRESVPGFGTSPFAKALLSGPTSLREAYTGAAPSVPVYQALGDVMPTAAPRTGTGAFRAPTPGAPLETNPLNIERPIARTIRTKPDLRKGYAGNELAIDRNDLARINRAESLAGFLDMQNGMASHAVIPGEGSSAFIRAPRGLNSHEMQNVAQELENIGFGASDTGAGVSALDFGGGGGNYNALLNQLPNINAIAERHIPGATAAIPMRFGKGTSTYTDMAKEMSQGAAGSGAASNKLAGMFTGKSGVSDLRALSSRTGRDTLADAIDARLMRDADFRQQLGLPRSAMRADYTRALKFIRDKGLAEFFKAVQAGTIAAPVAAAIVQSLQDGQENDG